MGFTPAIMDYVRFNYFAQPGDGIPPEGLAARVAQTTQDIGFDGFLLADKVVRWQLTGNSVLLRDVDWGATADPRTPMAARAHPDTTRAQISRALYPHIAVSVAAAPAPKPNAIAATGLTATCFPNYFIGYDERGQ